MSARGSRGSTGGNLFVGPDPTRAQVMTVIEKGIVALEKWVEGTEQAIDYGKVYIDFHRIPSGSISIEVTADLVDREPSEGSAS